MTSDRRARVHALADAIRVREHCDILSNATLDLMGRTLADYAIACLSDTRQRLVVEMMDAPAKHRAIAILSAAIHEESQ